MNKIKLSFLTKRFFDILISIIGIFLLFPITLIVCLLKLLFKDHTPLFFFQKRFGKNGSIFTIYKFNTMITNADIALDYKLKTDDDIKCEYFLNRKITNDFRVTPIGKFLRRTNLDEWPQFINILKNEMSFIGPRPYLLDELNLMSKNDFSIITSFKPGLTGLWQTHNKFDKTFKKRIDLDKKYCLSYSPFLDIHIFFKTIFLF